jgi:hypothetical protein
MYSNLSTGIPTNRFIDKKDLLARDEARNRAISINLQKKFVPTRLGGAPSHPLTRYPPRPQYPHSSKSPREWTREHKPGRKSLDGEPSETEFIDYYRRSHDRIYFGSPLPIRHG